MSRELSSFIDDPSLSAKAKGIYGIICYLQGKGIENPTIEDIQALCSDGRDSIRTGLADLRSAGVIPPHNRKLPTKPQGPGFVYLFGREGSNLYKIGLSKNPEARVKQFSDLPGEPLTIVSKIQTQNMGAAEDALFAQFAAKRIGTSEWFDLDPDSVSKFCLIQDWEV